MIVGSIIVGHVLTGEACDWLASESVLVWMWSNICIAHKTKQPSLEDVIYDKPNKFVAVW